MFIHKHETSGLPPQQGFQSMNEYEKTIKFEFCLHPESIEVFIHNLVC